MDLRADLGLRRPKVADEALTVTGATVSADRKVVTLKIDGLKPNRVVRALTAAVRRAGRHELLSTEAWYTLNTLPGYVAPISDGLYELEDGISRRREFDTEHAGYSGTGFVSGFGTVGASVKIEVNAPKAGDYRMALRYARPEPVQRPEEDQPDRQRHEPPDHAAADRDVAELPALPRHGDAQRGREHDRAQARDGRRRPRQPRLRAARAARAHALRGRGGHAGGRRERPDRARRLQRPGYVGGYQNQGASTTFKVTALADGETDVTLGYATARTRSRAPSG